MKKKSLINITTHSGKMEGIPSISTSCILNARCQKRVNCDKSVCNNCFAHSYMKFRKELREALERNFHILTEKILTKEEIATLNINASFFRLEAFGDLNNNIQLINYINICRYYKNTRFALWTKNIESHVICLWLYLHLYWMSLFLSLLWKRSIKWFMLTSSLLFILRNLR